MVEFEVFIDESGLFVETSTDPADRVMAHSQKRKFASQLAGVMFQKDSFDENGAEKIIKKCCKQANSPFSNLFHAIDISPSNFSPFVIEAVKQFQQQNLQAFRIVNEEQITFGDRVSNYTNILAELLIRVCHELSKKGHESIFLHVTSASVTLPDDDTGFIESSYYTKRIDEYFARASIRKGYGSQTKNWKVKSFKLGSGKRNKVLQLCDLVSNASHDDFVKCDLAATSSLKSSIGKFDFTLSSDTFYDEVNEFVSLNSFGLAFVCMAQRSVDVSNADADKALDAKLAEVAERFNQLSVSAKLPQLRILLSWLQQSIETRVDLTFSHAAAEWIRTSLVGALHMQPDTDQLMETWLEFSATSLMITVQNHLGQTIEANRESERLDTLIPKLAGRWEYSTDIFEALIARAVHQNDCFDHQAARKGMDSVIGFFSNLVGFFADAFPGLFPESVQSDLWAKALGTKVQSETFLLLLGECTIEQARKTSDAAIEQFALADDKHRQFQFRSEIEAINGDWGSARKFLSMSLGLDDSSHDAIAHKIAGLETGRQGFPFLHWTRLGGMAASSGDREELDAFNTAFKANKFLNNLWIIGTASDHYPVHGILRRMAVVRAFNGDSVGANAAITRLRNVISDSDSFNPVFEAILSAALIQVAAIQFKLESGKYGELLDNKDSKKPGATQVISSLIKKTKSTHQELVSLFSIWPDEIQYVLKGKKDVSALMDLGKSVGY